jgi:hypothetical protein
MAQEKLAKLRKKSVEILVDGESYFLRYDLNALVELEDNYDNIEDAFNFEENPKGAISKLRKVLYVGLKANHKDISEEEVGGMFTVENLAEFQEAIAKAMDAAMPDEGEEKNLKAPKDHQQPKKK